MVNGKFSKRKTLQILFLQAGSQKTYVIGEYLILPSDEILLPLMFCQQDTQTYQRQANGQCPDNQVSVYFVRVGGPQLCAWNYANAKPNYQVQHIWVVIGAIK